MSNKGSWALLGSHLSLYSDHWSFFEQTHGKNKIWSPDLSKQETPKRHGGLSLYDYDPATR